MRSALSREDAFGQDYERKGSEMKLNLIAAVRVLSTDSKTILTQSRQAAKARSSNPLPGFSRAEPLVIVSVELGRRVWPPSWI
jgi:hypothetical protein